MMILLFIQFGGAFCLTGFGKGLYGNPSPKILSENNNFQETTKALRTAFVRRAYIRGTTFIYRSFSLTRIRRESLHTAQCLCNAFGIQHANLGYTRFRIPHTEPSLRGFRIPVQKLPSIRAFPDILSAGGISSLMAPRTYSSFSKPFPMPLS